MQYSLIETLGKHSSSDCVLPTFGTFNTFSFQFALRRRLALGPRGLPFFLGSFSTAQDDSLLVSFPSWSSSFCFLSDYFFVALFFLFPFRSSNHYSFSNRLVRTTGFLLYSCRLPNDSFLFCGLVPGLFQELPFVLRRGYRCLSMDFLLFHIVVPGLLPPAFVFTPTFFFPPRYISLCLPFISCAISFHFAAHILLSWSVAAFCCRPSPNNRMRMKRYVCLLSC